MSNWIAFKKCAKCNAVYFENGWHTTVYNKPYDPKKNYYELSECICGSRLGKIQREPEAILCRYFGHGSGTHLSSWEDHYGMGGYDTFSCHRCGATYTSEDDGG